MRLRRLQLTNFRQHADTYIALQDGITGILGANGAGKSTVIEAVAFGLYGADAIRGTKSTIRWDRAPARRVAEVTLGFEIEGQSYTLTRSETGARLYAGDTIVADGTSAANAYVPTLLGMGWKEFASSHLTSQKDLARIASMGPTERQAFYREVMGVARVDGALADARREQNDLVKERAGLVAGLGERAPLEEELAAATKEGQDAQRARGAAELAEEAARTAFEWCESAVAELRAAETEHQRLTREQTEAAAEMARTSAEVDRLTVRIEAAQAAANRAEEAEPEVAHLSALRKERDELLQVQATAQQRTLIEAELAKVRESIETSKSELAAAREVASRYQPHSLESHQQIRTDLVERGAAMKAERRDRHTRAEAAIQAAQRTLDRDRRRLAAIQEAGPSGACPTCTRALTEQYAAVVEVLSREIQGLEDDIESHSHAKQEAARVGEVEAEVARQIAELDYKLRALTAAKAEAERAEATAQALDRELQRLEASVHYHQARLGDLPADVVADADRLAAIEQAISRLEELSRQAAADRAFGDTRAELVKERAGVLRANEAAARRGADAEAALRKLAYDPKLLAAALEARTDAVRARGETTEARIRSEGAVRAAEARYSRAERDLAAYDARAQQLRELEARLRVVSAATERLTEFRVAVASGIRPEMEELVSGFVGLLTDGRYEAVTISEDFACTLHRDGVPVEVISGGEEDVVAVAMRLATSQMIAERAGHPLSLLILDEIFGSLDEVRRANALALFRRLRGVFPQILLISHIPESQHQVDHVVVVEYDSARGCSMVRSDGDAALPEFSGELAEVA